jgi:hypothetical protein
MAKTKAELEEDSERHRAIMADARAELQRGEFQKSVRLAASAWQYVDGMMQYDRRWGSKSEFESVDSIALVLRYAPLLFDNQSLDQLDALLKSQKRIDKNAAADLASDLTAAISLMWDAHRLWSFLEAEETVRQDELRRKFGGDQDRWRWMAETWEEMGLLQRTSEGGSYRLLLVSRLDARVRCKCSSCGAAGQAPKWQLFQELQCPKCKAMAFFVLLSA